MKSGNSISTLSGGKFKKLNSRNIDKSMFNNFFLTMLCVYLLIINSAKPSLQNVRVVPTPLHGVRGNCEV
jgi:hypothetical protein